MPTLQENYDDLISRIKECQLLSSCSAILNWDEETYMPPKGAKHRAEQHSLMAKLKHDRLTDPKIGELLSQVEGTDLTKDAESATAVNIREIRRTYDRATKLPDQLVQELARTTSLAMHAWRDARKDSEFSQFQPWLEKIITLKREEAQAVGFSGVIYDALLDDYEPGASTKEITAVFADFAKELSPFIAEISSSKHKPRKDILARSFPVDRQQIFCEAGAAAIGFDFSAGRLDVTTHPFCSGIGPGDCRLTTRYDEHEFNQAFFGTLHEAGHGMYEQNLPEEHYGTPMGEAISMGIHESQSRLWENQVGRSQPFWDYFFPRAQQIFGSALRDIQQDEFHFAVNVVEPSFIRVEADETTYNLHIILRFELEQALVSGDLKPADVPGAWNEKFQQFFQLTPPNDAKGCLQDIHWSMGGIGYFPTYSLGNLYGAQIMEKAREDLGELDEDFRRGDFTRLREWLTEKIYREGKRYRAQDLCKKITGKPVSHAPLMKYLKRKYGELYKL